ncbi:hypothetical protein N7466_007179 [Penicillium verhagenii]|uniref:uncharacterized protein n=1 Tax=Penicillium verhagenii TaxID=1562060 RepID=UPI00254560FF|nr:uncharacterized protein N7466_007179 [Penicillium verhagenii]KAJ5928223.1 hypothetical protein N7466_007179 [Penicillium verhagenii]
MSSSDVRKPVTLVSYDSWPSWIGYIERVAGGVQIWDEIDPYWIPTAAEPIRGPEIPRKVTGQP